MKQIALFCTLLMCGVAQAEMNVTKLDGVFYFSAESCGENGKASSCKMTFELKGAAAKAMYERMTVKAKTDTCTEGPVKDDGNGLRCYKQSETRFECDFGYQFSKRKFSLSDVSC